MRQVPSTRTRFHPCEAPRTGAHRKLLRTRCRAYAKKEPISPQVTTNNAFLIPQQLPPALDVATRLYTPLSRCRVRTCQPADGPMSKPPTGGLGSPSSHPPHPKADGALIANTVTRMARMILSFLMMRLPLCERPIGSFRREHQKRDRKMSSRGADQSCRL